MKPLDIVMLNMSGYAEWEGGVSNRNAHVLRELLNFRQVGKILAVDYPPLTLKRALRNHAENIVPTLEGGTVLHRSLYDKLTKLSDRLYVYSNSEFFLRPKHFVERLKRQVQSAGFDEYLLWSYVPYVMPYLKGFGQKLTVFDAVDNWAEHVSYRHMRDRLLADYSYIKQSADIILTVAEDLQKLFDNQPNVYWIPNGVDVPHYQTERRVINRDIADLPRPIIGYIGVIQDRVDIELIKFLATKNPAKTFVLVGPVWREVDSKSLSPFKNIRLLGAKSYEDAPAYIQQFDAALIPHKATSFVTSTNPMKVYEYLACGKPVIATKHSGVEFLGPAVYIADDPEDFNRKLYHALEEDSDELRRQRREAVEGFSWNNVVKRMLDIVTKKMSY